jgi:hypothetical protein
LPLLILTPRFTQDTNALWKTAVGLAPGWDVYRLRTWRVPEEIKDTWHAETGLAIYGEPLFCAGVAEQFDRVLLEPPFEWLSRVPEDYLKRSVQFTTLKDARVLPGRSFIKPADDKCFPARVYGSALDFQDQVALLPDSTPVLISELVTFEVETRNFVMAGAVRTSSCYARLDDGKNVKWISKEVEMKSMQRFMMDLLRHPEVESSQPIVIDVGWIRGRGWAVIEANPMFGSGIYDCDPKVVLDLLQYTSVPIGESAAYSRWIPDRSG